MNKLVVSSSPHISSPESVRGIMLDVIIALIPAGVMSVWLFGIRALLLILTCVMSCVLSEYISRRIMKRSCTIGDLSAVVTGILLAYNLPPSLPLWMAVIGSAVAIVVVKQLFGGIGQNFVNPALIGRIVLMNSFTTAMTTWTAPFAYRVNADAVTSATALVAQSGDSLPLPTLTQMLFGQRAGCLGETCVIALLIGFVYLVIRRIINPLVPIVFVGTVALCSVLHGDNALYQIMSGGLILGAVFMATDYATTPVTLKGKLIFAFGCGLITSFIRFFGSLPEGVSYSIIIMNIVTPYIDRLTAPKPFGYIKPQKKSAVGEAEK